MAEGNISASRPWVIYGLHSGDGVIRYVGYTQCLSDRLNQHRSAARNGKEYRLYRWYRACDRLGRTVEATLLEQGCGDWEVAERHWIEALKTNRLLNVADGGMHIPPVPSEARARAAEKLKARVFTEEHRRRISAAKRGKKRPDNAERNRAMAERLRGKKMNLSNAERERRAEHGRKSGAWVAAHWQALPPEERARRSELARVQMRAVWEKRREERGSG